MTQARLNHLLGHLHRAAAGPPSDGALLGRFIESREEWAFAALVRRHGSMVLGVCRRVLGDPHDAEDAFQATFLVLARKAASLRLREAVGGWLHGVACRTALEARTRRARLRRHEKPVSQLPEVEAKPADPWEELRPLLDHEVHRLPDIYRLAIVLCDLQGQSRKAAAEQLGVPEGTLSSRLAAARKRLARRLSRHGLALSAGGLAVLVGKNATAAAVPAALVESTTRAALLVAAGQAAAVSGAVAALTEGVLKTMVIAKVKMVTVVLLGVAVLGLGTGKMYYAADPGQPGQAAAAQEKGEQDRDGRKLLTGGRTQQGQQGRRADTEKVEDRRLLEAQARAQEAQRVRNAAEARLEEARLDLERARRAEAELLERARRAEAEARQQGQRDHAVGQPRQGVRAEEPPRVREAPRQRLKASAEKLRADYLARREQLQIRQKKLEEATKQIQAEMQELEARYRLGMEALRLQEAEAARQQEIRPEQRKAPQPAAGDKLDRILDKLEQLERRLDRLERAGR